MRQVEVKGGEIFDAETERQICLADLVMHYNALSDELERCKSVVRELDASANFDGTVYAINDTEFEKLVMLVHHVD